MTTKGFRRQVFKEAEGCSAMTNNIVSCIRSVDGGLVVTVAFESTTDAGRFIYNLRTLCEYRDLEMKNVERTKYERSDLDVYIGVKHYVSGQTGSPPGSRDYALSRSNEESLPLGQSDVTKLDSKSEQAVFQALEKPPKYNQMDSAHIMSSSECKDTPIDDDTSNRFAMTTGLHRAYDGTSDRHPPWVRIGVEFIEADGLAFDGQLDMRYCAHLVIDFPSKAHADEAMTSFDWKDGTVIDADGKVRTKVYVVNSEIFRHAIEWKFAETTKVWTRLALQQGSSG
ncbi:unnamed protein product [Ectocarpus sp. 8 AP-2014]